MMLGDSHQDYHTENPLFEGSSVRPSRRGTLPTFYKTNNPFDAPPEPIREMEPEENTYGEFRARRDFPEPAFERSRPSQRVPPPPPPLRALSPPRNGEISPQRQLSNEHVKENGGDIIVNVQEIHPSDPLYKRYLSQPDKTVIKERIIEKPRIFEKSRIIEKPVFVEKRRELSKEEYNEAVERNLHVWNKWRTDVNDELIEKGRPRHVPPLEDAVKGKTPYDGSDPDLVIKDPVTLMKYSVGVNQVTELDGEDFLRYGIPRANTDAHNRAERRETFKRHTKVIDNSPSSPRADISTSRGLSNGRSREYSERFTQSDLDLRRISSSDRRSAPRVKDELERKYSPRAPQVESSKQYHTYQGPRRSSNGYHDEPPRRYADTYRERRNSDDMRHRDAFKPARDDSPRRYEERRRDDSPRKYDSYDRRRDDSPRKYDSYERRRDDSPRRRDDSPRRRDDSPRKYDSYDRRRDDSPRRRSDSPRRYDDSYREPRGRKRSPRRDDSPRRRRDSPRRRDDSPRRYRDDSPSKRYNGSYREDEPRRYSDDRGRYNGTRRESLDGLSRRYDQDSRNGREPIRDYSERDYPVERRYRGEPSRDYY